LIAGVGAALRRLQEKSMTQFYVQRIDEDQCRSAMVTQKPITITGVTFNGTVRAFTGVVRTVENVPAAYPDYPLRVTMAD